MIEKLGAVTVWGIGSLIIAQTDIAFLPKSVAEFGLAIALVVFFVWTGNQREKRMAARIDKIEGDDRERMMACIDKSADAMKATADSNARISVAFERLEGRLSDRPCMIGKTDG